MTPRVPVGLLGCGRIARVFHLPILAAQPELELLAVAEPDPAGRDRARAAAPGADVVQRVDALVLSRRRR